MTARETRTSSFCIFKLENKQVCTLWTCFFHGSTFRGRSLPINDFKSPVLKLHGARDLTRYFVFVFFTKRWWQIHSSVIRTHFARTIILNKQDVIIKLMPPLPFYDQFALSVVPLHSPHEWLWKGKFPQQWTSVSLLTQSNSSKDKRIDLKTGSSG